MTSPNSGEQELVSAFSDAGLPVAGRTVSMEIAQAAIIEVDGASRALDLRLKASRRLAETAAIHAHPDGAVLENLPGIGNIDDVESDAGGIVK